MRSLSLQRGRASPFLITSCTWWSNMEESIRDLGGKHADMICEMLIIFLARRGWLLLSLNLHFDLQSRVKGCVLPFVIRKSDMYIIIASCTWNILIRLWKTSSAQTEILEKEDQPSNGLQCASSTRKYLMPLIQGCAQLENRKWQVECRENQNSKITYSFDFSER